MSKEDNLPEISLETSHQDGLVIQEVFHHSPDTYIIFDLESGTIVECNPSAEKMFKGTREQIIGLSPEAIAPEYQPDGKTSAEAAGAIIEKVLTEGPQRFEWVHKQLDGQCIFCDVTLSPLKIGDKTVLLGSSRDITEAKLREKELREAQKRFDLVTLGSDVGIWTWDFSTNVVTWSDRLYDLLGYTKEDITPSLEAWSALVHEEEQEMVMGALNNHLKENSPYIIEHRLRTKDGSYRWFRGSGHAERNSLGEPVNMAGSLECIQERKLAELQNKRLLELLEASTDFIGQADKDKNLTYLNPAFKKHVGFGEPERRDIPDWHTPEDMDKLMRVIFPEAEKNGLWQGEVGLIDTKGNNVPCSLLEMAHKNDKGEIDGYSAIFRDISELKKKESELLKQTKMNEHQAKLAAIGQLAAGVGHEINNPLTIIRGYINAAEDIIKKRESPENNTLLEILERVNLAAKRISNITIGLRNFARNDVESIECFSVRDVLHESQQLVQEIYSRKGIALEVREENSPGDPFICANKGKFQQVLMNLISNARDAVENSHEKKIEITTSLKEDLVVIDVRDSGMGMSEEVTKKIFDPFYTTKDVNEGTGLGLSLVREYLEEMEGVISFETKEGEFTKFTLKIPVASEDVSSTHQEVSDKTPVEEFAHRALSVLVVDDEPGICHLLSFMLKELGHVVDTCENGQLALDKYLEAPRGYDLIISDVQMPVMDGPTFLRKLRSNQSIHQPLFLFTTGGVNMDFECDNNPLKDMIDGYIYKPFETEPFQKTIDRCARALANSQAT